MISSHLFKYPRGSHKYTYCIHSVHTWYVSVSVWVKRTKKLWKWAIKQSLGDDINFLFVMGLFSHSFGLLFWFALLDTSWCSNWIYVRTSQGMPKVLENEKAFFQFGTINGEKQNFWFYFFYWNVLCICVWLCLYGWLHCNEHIWSSVIAKDHMTLFKMAQVLFLLSWLRMSMGTDSLCVACVQTERRDR